MVKGYKTPRHAYVGHSPEYREPGLGHHFPGEDEWLFVDGRRSQSEPWRDLPQPPIRVLPKLHPKKATMARVRKICEANERVCPKLRCWSEMDKFMAIRGPVPWQIRGSMYSFEWDRATDQERRVRFMDQLAYAESVGTLRIFARFLLALSEEEWHHVGETAT